METKHVTAADVIGRLLQESADFPTLSSIAGASSLSAPTVTRWRDDHQGSIPHDQLASFLEELGREPEDYGVQPSIAWRSRRAMREQRALPKWAAGIERLVKQQASSSANIHRLVADVPVMRQQLTIIAEDLAAIRAHLGIPRETGASA